MAKCSRCGKEMGIFSANEIGESICGLCSETKTQENRIAREAERTKILHERKITSIDSLLDLWAWVFIAIGWVDGVFALIAFYISRTHANEVSSYITEEEQNILVSLANITEPWYVWMSIAIGCVVTGYILATLFRGAAEALRLLAKISDRA